MMKWLQHFTPNVKPAKKTHLNPVCKKTRNGPPGSWSCSLEVIHPGDYYSEYQLILQSLSQSQILPISLFFFSLHGLAPKGSTEEKAGKELA